MDTGIKTLTREDNYYVTLWEILNYENKSNLAQCTKEIEFQKISDSGLGILSNVQHST